MLFVFHLSYAQKREYSVSVTITGEGSVVPSKTTATSGEIVSLFVRPAEGYILQNIEAFCIPSESNGIGIVFQTSLTRTEDNCYTIRVEADVIVEATFIPRRPDTGKTAYALYLSDNTLFFTYTANELSIGDDFYNSTIAYLWSGIDVTDTPTKSSYLPKWNQLEEVDSEFSKVIFDENFSEVTPTSTCNWFSAHYNKNLISIEGLQYLNTSQVTSMYGMFQNCSGLTSLDLSHFDTHNVTDMGRMFDGCSSLTELDVSSFETQNVTNMVGVFSQCSSLTYLDVSHFDTRNVENMTGMFRDCSSLLDLDLTHFETPSLTKISQMFSGCSSLASLDVSHLNTASVTYMYGLFMNCSGIKTLDLSNFDMRKVTIANRMFEGCTSLERIFCDDKWYIRASSNMFTDCPMLHGAVAWDASSVNVDMANPIWGYFTYASGDLDEDGILTPLDVDLLVQLILKGTFHTRVSDINHDSRLSLSDVTALVNRIK